MTIQFARVTRNIVAVRMIVAFLMTMLAMPAAGQWLKYPAVEIPRAADGTPDLSAPAPRMPDGRPDLSGVWQMSLGLAYSGNIVADLKPDEIMPWADALFRQRLANIGTDDSSLVGCLPRGPRYFVGSGAVPQYVKIVQTPRLITILYEELAFRQIFLDGRQLPSDPNPSFMGYSVGRWEGDTLVVDSAGFNDRTWLDFGGHPHTEALRITERFRRTSTGRIDLQVTLSDPGAYARPWTVPVLVTLAADTDLLEYVCAENQNPRMTLGRTEAEKAVRVSPEVLSDYVGTYRAARVDPGRRLPFSELRVFMQDGELLLDIDGKGRLPMIPLSQTTFSVRLVNVDFVRDERGVVTHLVNIQNGARFQKQP